MRGMKKPKMAAGMPKLPKAAGKFKPGKQFRSANADGHPMKDAALLKKTAYR